MPDMPVNTTNAAYSVKDNKMYVLEDIRNLPVVTARLFKSSTLKEPKMDNEQQNDPNQIGAYGVL